MKLAPVSKPSPAQDAWLFDAAVCPSAAPELYVTPNGGVMPVGDGGNRSGYDQVKSPAPPEVDHSACDDNGCAAYDPPPDDDDAATAKTAPDSAAPSAGASPPVPDVEGEGD